MCARFSTRNLMATARAVRPPKFIPIETRRQAGSVAIIGPGRARGSGQGSRR